MVVSHKDDYKRGVDFIGITVSFIVHDGNGRVLVQKRSQKCRDEQETWDVGGGAVEFSEKLTDAVDREIKEELATKPLEIKFLQAGEAHRTSDGKPTHWIWLLHSVKVDPALVKIGDSEKIDEIKWITLSNIPSPAHTMLPYALKVAKQNGLLRS
ncbi:MAG: NUDIX hydrolase [Candidatus Saccharimonadales bacterium]